MKLKDGEKSFIKKVAEEDVTCYKVVRWLKEDLPTEFYKNPEEYDLATYYTPYMRMAMKAGEEYTTDEEWKIESDILYHGDTQPTTFIEKGGFHAYQHLACADYAHRGIFFSRVAECVIPKGTEYYEGTDTDFRVPCYCAKRLRVNKVFEAAIWKITKSDDCKSCRKEYCNMKDWFGIKSKKKAVGI